MELLDLNTVWSATLTLLVSVMAYIVNEKFRELARITILLNKTREEVARDNVTQTEIDIPQNRQRPKLTHKQEP